VIGSFNFLSYEGFYGEGARFRQRSEVGVLLTGDGVADRILAEIGRAIPEAVREWPGVPDRAPSLPQEPSLWSPADDQTLLTELAEVAAERAGGLTDPAQADGVAATGAGERLLEAVRAEERPWPLLDRFGQAGLPARLLRQSVAASLADRAPPESERLRWLAWLAADSWRRGGFVEAAVLTTGLTGPEPPELPHPIVVRVAAARAVGAVGADLWAEAILTEGLSPAARAALAAVAAAELAARAEPSADEVLTEFRPALSPAWRRVADAVADFWRQSGAPLPTSGLGLQAAAEGAWQRLRQALERAGAKHFKFPSGNKTHQQLFGGEGAFALLRRSVDREDAGAVAAWLAREGVDRLGNYLDEATRAADATLVLIGAPVRETYLTLLQAVVDAAREVAAVVPSAGGEDARRQAERAREVARVVHREWDTLALEAVVLQAPEAVLLGAVRANWRHLFDWGAQ
jgi:hypothetical protein